MCPRRALHPVEDLHQGRLAGPVLADDGVDLTGQDGEVHVVVGDHSGEPLGDSPELDRRRDVTTSRSGRPVLAMAARTLRVRSGTVISPSMICCL
jgi:hypothetical protein